MHVNQVRALRDRALLCGAHPTSPLSARWDVFGKFDRETGEIRGHVCTQPKSIYLWERPMRDAPGNPQPAGLTLNVRCRGCVSCRKHRQVCFRQRAYAEYASAARSRFFTFTFAPSFHARVDRKIAKWIEAEIAVPTRFRTDADVGVLREILTAVRQRTTELLAGKARRQLFALRESELGREVTLFLKRLRERSGSKIRYALVAEAHTKALRGRPHFHMLMHEVDPTRLVRKKHIRGSWRAKVGFVSQKLTDGDSRAPAYLAKYLTKADVHLRRVSKHYGGPRRVMPTPMGGLTPLGVGRSHEPVVSRDETTPQTRERPGTERAKPEPTRDAAAGEGCKGGSAEHPALAEAAQRPSLLRRWTLEDTWDEPPTSRTDRPIASAGTSRYRCEAPGKGLPEGASLEQHCRAGFQKRLAWRRLH